MPKKIEKLQPDSESNSRYVKVIATKRDLWEPFQQVRLLQGTAILVEKTSWIDSQLEIGLLVIE